MANPQLRSRQAAPIDRPRPRGLGILLVTGHRRALGWVLLMEALAAYGDMTNVLAHHGSVATALGVHCLTATLMVVNGLLIMRETRNVAAKAAPETPAPQPG